MNVKYYERTSKRKRHSCDYFQNITNIPPSIDLLIGGVLVYLLLNINLIFCQLSGEPRCDLVSFRDFLLPARFRFLGTTFLSTFSLLFLLLFFYSYSYVSYC